MIQSNQNSNLEENPKLGFYTVGNQRYYSKVQALIQATQTGDFPLWNFNNEIYQAQNWQNDSAVDIRTLYRLRAQQLRDRYDYIRLECSGGADSTQAVFAFLLNGIHLDEIVFRFPKAGKGSIEFDPHNYKTENTLSEAEYAARPLLDWISTNYAGTTITVHDYSQDMIESTHSDESWIYSSKEFLQPGHVTKFPNFGTQQHRNTADSGKTICILYGIDKPKICVKDHRWYLYFMDFQANYANPEIGPYTNICNEYFYWTPDLPEISVRQAHIIKNWFDRPENRYLQYLIRWPNHSVAQRTTYESLIKPLIYPDYDPMTFQVNKPGSNFYSEMDFWFYENFNQTRLYTTWKQGIEFAVQHIDRKYFNWEADRATGFVGFLSPFYDLGPANNTTDSRLRFGAKIPDRFDPA